MTWLSWRQLRVQAALTAAAVLALIVVLAATGPRLTDLAARTTNVYDAVGSTDRLIYDAGIVVMAVLPGLFGAFWGAPLVARELEQGTHTLAWNQSVTPARWLAAKLATSALAAALLAGALTAAVTWWSDPLDGAVSASRGGFPSRLTPIAFAMRGVVPAAYAVLAVVIGVAAGLVVRRTLPAMALTLALVAVFQITMPIFGRPHLVPPMTATVVPSASTMDGISADSRGRPLALTVHLAHGDWIISDTTVDAAGRPSGLPASMTNCQNASSAPVPAQSGPGSAKAQAGPVDPCLAQMAAEGYRQRVVYQPAGRFWPLQLTEAAFCLALAAGLAGLCLLGIRRVAASA